MSFPSDWPSLEGANSPTSRADGTFATVIRRQSARNPPDASLRFVPRHGASRYRASSPPRPPARQVRYPFGAVASPPRHRVGPHPYAIGGSTLRLRSVAARSVAASREAIRPRHQRCAGAPSPAASESSTGSAQQPSDLAGLRAAVGLLEGSQSILSGEPAPLLSGRHLRVRPRPRDARSGSGGLVTALLNTQSPSAHLVQCHRFSLCDHRFSSPPPYSNSKGCRCLINVGREGSASNLGASRAIASG